MIALFQANTKIFEMYVQQLVRANNFVFDWIFKQKSVCSGLLGGTLLPDLGTVRFFYLFNSQPNSKL